MAFRQRKFKVRAQRFDASKKRGARIGLVSQRRITVAGRTVKAGTPVDFSKPAQLRQVISKPKKFKNPYGSKLKAKRKSIATPVKAGTYRGKNW